MKWLLQFVILPTLLVCVYIATTKTLFWQGDCPGDRGYCVKPYTNQNTYSDNHYYPKASSPLTADTKQDSEAEYWQKLHAEILDRVAKIRVESAKQQPIALAKYKADDAAKSAAFSLQFSRYGDFLSIQQAKLVDGKCERSVFAVPLTVHSKITLELGKPANTDGTDGFIITRYHGDYLKTEKNDDWLEIASFEEYRKLNGGMYSYDGGPWLYDNNNYVLTNKPRPSQALTLKIANRHDEDIIQEDLDHLPKLTGIAVSSVDDTITIDNDVERSPSPAVVQMYGYGSVGVSGGSGRYVLSPQCCAGEVRNQSIMGTGTQVSNVLTLSIPQGKGQTVYNDLMTTLGKKK